MTEVWKSNPRKFCELCKVWFADNKVSIEHHESGLKHKNAIQMKLRDLGKQNKANQEKELALHATIAQMEAAAVMSILNEGATNSCAPIGPAKKPKKSKSYMDPRAHSSVTAMAKEVAKRKKEAEKALVKKSQYWKDSDEEEEPVDDDDEQIDEPIVKKERKDEIVWTETRTDAGLPYYFHIYSGETVWETPKRYYTAKQYAARLNDLDSEGMAHGSDAQPRTVTAPRRAWGLKLENKASLSIKEAKQNRATRRAQLADTKQTRVPKPKTEPISTDHPIDPWLACKMVPPPRPPQFDYSDITDTSHQVGTSPMGVQDIPTPDLDVAETSNEQPSIPYEEGAAVAASFRIEDHDIPLPPPPQDPIVENPTSEADISSSNPECVDPPTSEEMSCIKREPDDEGDTATGSEEMPTALTDEIGEIPEETGKVHPFFHRPAVYGEWRKVTKPVEQPNVDYELPTEEEGRVAKQEHVIRPEDVVVFEEKTAPVTNKKKKKDAPIMFKKRKTTINARKRDGD